MITVKAGVPSLMCKVDFNVFDGYYPTATSSGGLRWRIEGYAVQTDFKESSGPHPSR